MVLVFVIGWRSLLDCDGHLDDVGHWMAMVIGWRWSWDGVGLGHKMAMVIGLRV